MAAAGGSWVTSKSGKSHRFVTAKQTMALKGQGKKIVVDVDGKKYIANRKRR